MTKSRANALFQTYSEEQMQDLNWQDFIVSEIEELITESPMDDTTRIVAKCHFIEKKSLSEISNIVDRDRNTIDKKIKLASQIIKQNIYKVVVKNL